MTDQITKTPTATNDDPWSVADNAKPRALEYYGQVKADVWFGYFPGDGAKPIPFDPAIHPADKRTAQIEIHIIPIPEQSVSWDIYQGYSDFSTDWTKITLPSIKAIGFDGLKNLNGRWVRVAMADGKREKKDKATGQKTGEFYPTFKFIEAYADQAACSVAYAGNSHHTEQPPLPDAGDAEKKSALAFATVIVKQSVAKGGDLTSIIADVTTGIAGMPMLNKHFTGDSPEILTLIQEAMTK